MTADLDIHKPVHIIGFGNCFIEGGGTSEGGFLRLACRELEKTCGRSVNVTVVPRDLYSLKRASENLERLVLSKSPTHVVFQFGTGAYKTVFPHNNVTKLVPKNVRSVLVVPTRLRIPNHRDLFRWTLKSLLFRWVKPKPDVSIESYASLYRSIIEKCLSHHVVPIVVSPFIYGVGYTTHLSKMYSHALERMIAEAKGAIFVDCITSLSKAGRRNVLFADGFYLSDEGHRIVGATLAKSLAKALQPISLEVDLLENSKHFTVSNV